MSETGHKINLENFELVITRVTELGILYTPGNPLLLIPAMTAQSTAANTLQTEFNTALAEASAPMQEREIFFINLQKLITRAINYYESLQPSKQAIAKARGLVKAIRGTNVRVERLENGEPDPTHISNSHQSFAQILNNYHQLVELIKVNTDYLPLEIEINIASLETAYTDGEALTTSVNEMVTHAIMKRVMRDHALYDLTTGIIDVALACKKYVRSKFGALSDEAKTVTSIKFVRFKKMEAL